MFFLFGINIGKIQYKKEAHFSYLLKIALELEEGRTSIRNLLLPNPRV